MTIPKQVWIVGGAVLFLVVAGFSWGYTTRVQHERDEAIAALAQHLHADSSTERLVSALYKSKTDSLAAQLVLNADLRADERVARASIRTVHDTVLKPGQIIRDTLHAVANVSSNQLERLGLVCDSLAQADSIAAELAFQAKTTCDARHAADSSLIADLTARVKLASAPVPRLSIQAGAGYDVLLGRPLVRGETLLRVLGPVSVGATVDVVPGLAQPVEARAVVLWRF
jgi:hypothetical protein